MTGCQADLTWEAEESEGAAGSWKGEQDSTLEGLTSGTPRLRFSRDQRLLQVQLETVPPAKAIVEVSCLQISKICWRHACSGNGLMPECHAAAALHAKLVVNLRQHAHAKSLQSQC